MESAGKGLYTAQRTEIQIAALTKGGFSTAENRGIFQSTPFSTGRFLQAPFFTQDYFSKPILHGSFLRDLRRAVFIPLYLPPISCHPTLYASLSAFQPPILYQYSLSILRVINIYYYIYISVSISLYSMYITEAQRVRMPCALSYPLPYISPAYYPSI